jgi:hypothetical protein
LRSNEISDKVRAGSTLQRICQYPKASFAGCARASERLAREITGVGSRPIFCFNYETEDTSTSTLLQALFRVLRKYSSLSDASMKQEVARLSGLLL